MNTGKNNLGQADYRPLSSTKVNINKKKTHIELIRDTSPEDKA